MLSAMPRPPSAEREAPGLESVVRIVLETLGLVLLLMAWRRNLYHLHGPLGLYDEGILLTNSMLVSRGEVPYRDFYSNYGPGIFVTIAGAWKLLGTSALAGRLLGFSMHVLLAVGSGLLGGRILGRRFSFLAAGLVAVWLSALGTFPYAWLAALALLLACVLALGRAVDASSRRAFLASGALLGAASWYRPDLAAYFSLALVGASVLASLRSLRSDGRLAREIRRGGALFLPGALVTALPVWGAAFLLAGRQVIDDLFLDQARYVQPARLLPLPPLAAWLHAPDLPVPLPAFLVALEPAAVAVVSAAALAGILLAATAGGRRAGSRSAVVITGALWAAVLPQALGRSDGFHLIQAVPPSIVLLAALAHRLVEWGRLRALLAAVLVAWLFAPARHLKPTASLRWPLSTRDFPRYGGIPEGDPAMLALLGFLADRTAPGDRIFVGLHDHSRTLANAMLVYFLADRAGGTRNMQFDPNLTDRESTQRLMIRDLERSGVRWVVRGHPLLGYEPNESRRPGSRALDEHLLRHFAPVARFGGYEVWQRVRREGAERGS